jgi:hypothetical protein
VTSRSGPESTERVLVKLEPAFKKALKQYAAFYGLTMGEVLYNCLHFTFHRQAKNCSMVCDLLENLDIPIDKRAAKPCFGMLCHNCSHKSRCRAGLYDGCVELEAPHLRHLTTEGLLKLRSMQVAHGQQPQDAT